MKRRHRDAESRAQGLRLETYPAGWKPGCLARSPGAGASTARHLRSVSGHRGWRHTGKGMMPLRDFRALASGVTEESETPPLAAASPYLQGHPEALLWAATWSSADTGLPGGSWHSCLPKISSAPNTGLFAPKPVLSTSVKFCPALIL